VLNEKAGKVKLKVLTVRPAGKANVTAALKMAKIFAYQ
jgi:hypothetical protein